MASLTGQSISSSYEQLLSLPDGGLNGTTLVAITDGDSSTEVAFKISTNALSMNSTNQLQFGDTGTYIHQSADGVLDLVSDTEIEINATTIDMNGALDLSGNATIAGNVGIGDTPHASRKLVITGTNTTNATSSVYTNAIHTGTTDNAVFSVRSDNASASGTVVNIHNDGSGACLNLNSNGSGVALIADSNVGIGESSSIPSRLSVANTGTDIAVVKARSTTSNARASYQIGNDADNWYMGIDGGNSDSFFIADVVDSSDRLVITQSGSIGVGTDSPSGAGLHINGSGNPGRLKIQQTSASDYSLVSYVTPSRQWNVGVGGASGASELQDNFFFQDVTGSVTPLILDTNSRISLSNNDASARNTIFGYQAMNVAGVSASDNVAIGNEAMHDVGTSQFNVAVGSLALTKEVNGDRNVAIGYQSLYSQSNSGTEIPMNTAVGGFSGYTNVTGVFNTYVGGNAGFGSASGSNSNNVGIGYNAMLDVSTGSNNVAIGKESAQNLTDGEENVIIGDGAGQTTTSVHDVVVVGRGAMQIGNVTNAADGTVAVGYKSLEALVSGERNLAVGYKSLYQSDECDDSIAIGYEALGGTDAGANSKNIAIGNYALDANMTNCVNNIAIGYQALTAATGGVSNVAIGGSAAGAAITTADRIVAIGDGALGGAAQSDGNTGVGYACLYSATGAKNTAFGYQTANTVTDGTENTVVGWDADASASGAVNQTVIGSETTGVSNNSVTLGNASVTDVYMAQDKHAKVHMGDFHLQNGTSFTFNDNASNELCSFEARYADSPTGTTGAHIAFRKSADDFTSGTETARIADIGTSGNINSGHSSSLEFHVISAGTMTKTLTVGSSDGSDRVQLIKGRLKFPASQNADSDANTLDDYEEGTWSPVFCNLSATNQEMTMNGEQAGTYVKIGRLVHISINIGASGNGSATNSDMAIKNLPFACGGSSTTDRGFRASFHVASSGGLNLPDGNFLVGFLNADTQLIELRKVDAVNGTDSGNTSQVSRDEISTDGGFIMSGTYIADA